MPSLSRSVEEYLASKQPLEIPNVTSQVRLLPGGRTADGTYATVYSGTYSNCQVATAILSLTPGSNNFFIGRYKSPSHGQNRGKIKKG